MFTVQQIKTAHAKVKSGKDFPAYVKEIKGLGLIRYEFQVTDGSITYYGANNYTVNAPAIYASKTIAGNASAVKLRQIILDHQQGLSDFLTLCSLVADVGVQKWVVDAQAMLCKYYSSSGEVLLSEPIPDTGY